MICGGEHMEDFDTEDWDLIKNLYHDSSLSAPELAKKVDLSEEEVNERVESWENSGLIQHYSTVLDPSKIGYTHPSYHYISLAENYNDEALRSLLEFFNMWKGSQFAFVVFGKYDAILRKISQSEADIDRFATNLINDPEYTEFDIETFSISQRIRWRGVELVEQREVTPVNLDKTEQEILRTLKNSAELRSSATNVARDIGIEPTEVEGTIRSLEESDVIIGYSTNFNQEKIGTHHAFVGLSAIRGEYDEVINELIDFDSFYVPYIQSGLGFNWAEIAVEIRFRDLDHLDDITDEIRKISGVRSSHTFVGTKNLKKDETAPVE